MFGSSIWDDYFDISSSSGDLIPAYASSDNMNETSSSSSTSSSARKNNELVVISTIVSIACVSVAWFQTNKMRKLRSQVYANNVKNDMENKSRNQVKSIKVNDDIFDGGKKVERNEEKEIKSIDYKAVEKPLPVSFVEPSSNDNKDNDTTSNGMSIKPIGTVSSLYRLCVGTPRQGLLAPHSKGIIKLDTSRFAPVDALDQLNLYSHLWIVFIFHLNTNNRILNETMMNKKKNKNQKSEKGKGGVGGHRLFPSKVSPPALGGKKVGMFATRTPHRPNPIGFSLCQLDYVDTKAGFIYISGLDLVDGTPVVDIKPYVPHYDSIGYISDPLKTSWTNKSLLSNDKNMNSLSLPTWVSSGLQKRRPVHFTLKAEQQLYYFVSNDLLEFYNYSRWREHGKYKKQDESSPYVEIRSCIIEVLSVDVRSSWQTKKARNGASQADRALKIKQTSNVTTESMSDAPKSLCTQQLDNLLIYFTVKDTTKNKTDSQSHGSGCNDIVVVKHIQYINFKDTNENDYHNEVWNDHSGAMYEEVWEMLLESIENDCQMKSEKKTLSNLVIVNENKIDLKKRSDHASCRKDTESINYSKEHVKVKNMRQTKKRKNESSVESVPQTPSHDQQQKINDTVLPQEMTISNQDPLVASTLPKDPQQINRNKRRFAISPVKTPPKVVKSKKNILVPTAVQDSGDYNKLQSYWKEVAKNNTPTGVMPEPSKQIVFKDENKNE